MTDPHTPVEMLDAASRSNDLDAAHEHDKCSADAGSDAGDRQQGSLLKSGVDAREAAQMRWAKHRARQEAGEVVEDAADGEIILVRVPVKTGEIIARLERDARNGDTRSARELRAWLAEVQVERETAVSDLDERTRQRLLSRLLAEIEEEDRDAAAAATAETTVE